jgi:hypothetical protein
VRREDALNKTDSLLNIIGNSIVEMIKAESNAQVKKVNTETITFRLPSNLIDGLRKEAESDRISLNSMVTKIFANHIQWEKYERKVGLLPMTRTFLKEVVNQLSEEQIASMAQRTEKETFKNILTFMRESHSIEDFIFILRTWLNVSWMQHNIEQKDGYYRFHIQHDLGIKWSIYVKILVSELSEDILNRKVQVKISASTISLVFQQ